MKRYRVILVFFYFLLFRQALGQFHDISNTTFPLPDPASSIIFEVPYVNGNIISDGQINETAWVKAGTISKFYKSSDVELIPVDVKVSLLYDSNALILGFDMPLTERNNTVDKCFLSDEYNLVQSGSYVSISIDPGHEHGVYYQFVFDRDGRKQDLRVGDETWSSTWSVNNHVSDNRWKAEVCIPMGKLFHQPKGGDFWGFNLVLKGFAGKDALSATPIKIDLVDAERFGHLLFTGALGKEKLAEIITSLPDVHLKQKKNRIDANHAMCGPEFINLKDELINIAIGSVFELPGGTRIKCVGIDNPEVIRSEFSFFYEKYENPELQRLRKLYRLDEIVASGKNEFEQILMLNEWLVKHVTFGSPPPILPQAFHVLDSGLVGQTYNCTYLSFTLMQMYTSLGFTARKITSVGHGTLDVWSNYWRKWMQIDPSRNTYFRLRGTAVPLNSNEIRREYWRNGGVDMEMVFGTEQRAEKVTIQRRKKDGLLQYRQDGYVWIAYKTRNNFFEIPFTYRNFLYLIIDDEYNHDKKWMNAGEIDEREVFGIRTKDIGDIFWTLNQAYIHLYDQGSNILKVQLETVTPNFDAFEISIDRGEWNASTAIYDWLLHSGQNTLKARSVNKFGLRGPEHKIVFTAEKH